jgi:putative ABC transport system substrate-binding protein
MRRRQFIASVGGAVAWPLVAYAQPATMPLVGILGSGSSGGFWTDNLTAFRQGLSEAGYSERHNISIEVRWAEDQYDRLPAMAADLIQHQAAVIAAFATPAAKAAKAATTTIPIVFTTIADPVEIGLVASLNRPGGNITGVTQLAVEVGPKLLELLHEAVPSATIMALLVNPTNPNVATQSQTLKTAGLKLGLQLHVLNANAPGDFAQIFAKLHELRAGALVISQDVLFGAEVEQLAKLSTRHQIPAIYVQRTFAAAGGLMSYGTNQGDVYRQAGIYAGRILKGEAPADLPVIRATKFDLVINLRTAKALGITVSLPLLGRADEVIE